MKLKTIPVLFLMAAIGGCSSKYQVEEVIEGSTKMSGVPFRVPATHKVHLVAFNQDSKIYEYLGSQNRVIASPDHVYTLGFDSKFLSDHAFKVTMNPNGTISIADLTSTDKSLETSNNLLDQVSAFRAQKSAAKETESSAASDLVASQDASLVAAVEASATVSVLEAELLAAQQSGNAIEIATKTSALISAKVKANITYRDAGLETPYPNVFP